LIALQHFRRFQRVLHQGRHRHRANPARYRGNPACACCGGFKADITDQPAIVQPVDANINHHRAGFDPFAGNKVRFSHRNDQNIRRFNMAAQDLGRGEFVTTGHGAACDQQLQRHRAANVVADPDNGRALPAHRAVGIAQKSGNPARCTRAQAKFTQGQMADVFRVKAIDILQWVNPLNQPPGIADTGQGQLDQHPVDRRIGIELVDQGEKFGLGGAFGEVVIKRADADFGRRAALVADIGLRGRVAADQHHRQSRRGQPGSKARINAGFKFIEQRFGDALAIKDAGGGAAIFE